MKLSKPFQNVTKKSITWFILVSWLFLSGLAMWFIFNQPYRHFIETKIPTFKQSKLLDGFDGLTVVHFVDKNCPCTRFSNTHIEALEQELTSANHVRIKAGEWVNTDLKNSMKDWLISSPSVAVFKESGQLAYYGPYTDALLCNQGNDLVKQVINSLGKDKDYQWFNVLGYGCFCDWPDLKVTQI